MRISGRSLAPGEFVASEFPVPKQLAGTSVTVNEEPVALYYVAHNQIYAETPAEVTGNVTVRVTTPNGATDITTNVP